MLDNGSVKVSNNSLVKVPGAKTINWLLIFDNVKCIQEAERYFPKNSRGTIIVTMRESDIDAVQKLSKYSTPIFVKPLDRAKSIQYLQQQVAVGTAYSKQEESEALTTIATEADGFLVSLEYFGRGAYPDRSFRVYLDENKYWKKLMHQGPSALFKESFDNLGDAEQLLLRTIVFMNIEAIPVSTFDRVGRRQRSVVCVQVLVYC